MQDVFIIGSKGIPGNYGGFETFVDKLTEYHQNNKNIKYHVACKGTENGEFVYNNARCFTIKVPEIGSAQAIYYDVEALKETISYIKKNNIKHPIVYILACRIGPFIKKYKNEIHKLGGKLYLNPDGHEWKRAKWSYPVRKYWKYSEELMIKHADLVICDSVNIEKYILEDYKKYDPKTTYIAYGAETKKSSLADHDETFQSWLKKNGLKEKEYYLIVGRFVPENNFETVIKEFMKSKTKKDLAIITTKNAPLLNELEKKLSFQKDKRIKFVGTVYDQELLMKIREQAFGYIHGHEVGGTNPSLLEALSSTQLNLLLDVPFNKEVGKHAALYWSKKDGNLADLIDRAAQLSKEDIEKYNLLSSKRIEDSFNWKLISNKYEDFFAKNLINDFR